MALYLHLVDFNIIHLFTWKNQTNPQQKLLYACLVNRLSQEEVHTSDHRLGLVLLARVCCDATDHTLLDLRENFAHELLDLHASIDSSQLWHTIVNQNEFVDVTLLSEALLNPLDSLVTVPRHVTLYVKLLT